MLAFGMALGARPAAATTYVITDLGTLGGTTSNATGINASGQVVGSSTTAGDTVTHAFLYSAGTMLDLGTLGGDNSFGQAINAAGAVVGYSESAGPYSYRAFLRVGGPMVDLGTLGGPTSSAFSINTGGAVVGGADTGAAIASAFRYDGGPLVDLGSLGGFYSQAAGINDAAQVVGAAETGSPTRLRAFLYDGGPMIDLGTLGGSSIATAINENGHVVGYSQVAGKNHAFLYTGGPLVDLGTSGYSDSLVYDINAADQVVGVQTNAYSPAAYRAFIWQAGVWQDLNGVIPAGSGWTLRFATGINDAGEIVGSGTIGGEQHGFLLTPSSPPTTTTSSTSTTTTTTLLVGFVPPNAAIKRCEDTVLKNLGRLVKCLMRCNQKAAAAGFAGRPFDQAACKSSPTAASCHARYNAASANLLAGGTCPVCQAPGNQATLADRIAEDVDATIPQVYCAGTTPLP